MLINLRNALMAGKRLPYDAEVEYLGGGSVDGGIAFVDTGYMPNSSTRIEATAAMLTGSAYSGRYGNGARLTFGAGNNQLYSAQGGHYFLGPFTTGRFYSFVNDIQNRTVSVDGATPTSTSAVANWYSQSYPFYLFVSNVAPTSGSIVIAGHSIDPNSAGGMRIASCRIYDNNILVRDFIPVRRGIVGYLYDRVTGRLFGNAGTGDFVLGQDVVPATWVDGEYWDALGVATALSGASRCDNFIPVQPSSTVTFYLGARPGGTTLRMIQYNGDKSRIDTAYASNGSARTVTIPANCYYIRVSAETAKKNEAYIHDDTNDRDLLRNGMIPIPA